MLERVFIAMMAVAADIALAVLIAYLLFTLWQSVR